MKNKYRRGIDMVDKYILFASIVLLITANIASASGLDTLSVSGDKQGTVGNFATIYINATGANDIGGIQLDFLYDPSIIIADTMTTESLAAGALPTFSIDNTTGKVKIGLISTTGITGNGSLVKINYSIVGTGNSTLNISVQNVTNTTNGIISVGNVINSTFEATTGQVTDTIAPTTNISGVTEGGNYSQNVTITLTASDNPGGSGVNRTVFIINGGPINTYSVPFIVSNEGSNNVEYWSIDNAGNIEQSKTVHFTINRSVPINGPIISNFTVSNSTGVNRKSPAIASADVLGNLKVVRFAVIDSNNLATSPTGTGHVILAVSANMSGRDGMYISHPWKGVVTEVTDGIDSNYITPTRISGRNGIFVPGLFKKNDTENEETVIARFNASLLGLTDVMLDNGSINGPLVTIEDGISTIRLGTLEYIAGNNQTSVNISNNTYTLYDTGGVNSSNNPRLSSVDIPQGMYTVIVHAEDNSNNANIQSMDVSVSNNTLPPPVTGPFGFTVIPSFINVGTGENAQYTLTINNTGNVTDIYNLTVNNPSGVNVSIGQDNISVNAGQSSTVGLTVNSTTIGKFIVNVTAISRANANNSLSVTTTTNVVMAKIVDNSFGVSNGQRSGAIKANVTVRNYDTIGHVFVIVVGGTDPIRGYPIVGTGTVRVNGNKIMANIPILVTIPTSADIGNYPLYVGLYNYDSGILSTSNLIGDIVGPQIATIS